MLVVIAAAVGALVGDNTAYGVGRSGLRRLADRLMNSDKSRRRLEWARAQLLRRKVLDQRENRQRVRPTTQS